MEKAVFWTRGLKQKVLSSTQVKAENLRKLPLLSYKNDETCTLKYTNSSLEANEWLHENKLKLPLIIVSYIFIFTKYLSIL